jgi:hypothetical protein
MASVMVAQDDGGRRRRRVRRSALLWALVALGFYLGFIVMMLVRGSR